MFVGGRWIDEVNDGGNAPEVPKGLMPSDLPLGGGAPWPSPRAFVGLVAGSPEDATDRWYAHVEINYPVGMIERSDKGTLEEVVAWARERTSGVLIVAEPLMWAGTDPRPDDVDVDWTG
ncbi:hypothetical protein [Nostocoides sp. HKS02]|uniref:hypothetical protein n=1 Tax=Nostocoides sp. HKS02 TaxID=1813880 RepID=UPI0012B458B7|nr:hypothetical protein [Tetrasphaera sp. HKS02]QGN58882.1 hypothetical protein GKE56_14425 [Tetrasphaera sp. HKS02]